MEELYSNWSKNGCNNKYNVLIDMKLKCDDQTH